ncbi:Predicted arabinose efflux permease, MFS family [Amycolatopsis pretoriensis]|uniref:Predicted arabinose efflux permease, MFS family n=2 Tax=Amycolatopsis pretoriensis TaxID=218821 RepID=A0A1H5RGE0_9PSEU|nr:MFS transporter [Amycolatopsis pretoriensis]SEF37456.1 Predicted arabinose efflux permease, MFS family [Amycolatopsis pretoriensis]
MARGIDREHRRVVLAAMAGTTIEWYDFFVYAISAGLVFATQYFSALGKDALILSFATVGISFFFRPIGAVVAGHLGDRFGRRAVLIATLLLMGVSTVLIGLVPTTASIGVAAPILLVLLRIVQGLSAGGEWGGAALLAVEHAPAGRRGLYGAFPQIGVPIGLLLANGALALAAAVTTPAQFLVWGWRIPFLLSFVLIVLGFVIRSRVAESPVFEEVRRTRSRSSLPLVPLLRHHGLLVVLGALLFAANNAVGYMTTGGYVQSYATKTLHLDRSVVLVAVMISAVAWLVSTLVGGWLADRVGRITVYRIGFAVQLVWMVPFFALLDTANAGLLVLALVLFSVGLGFTYGPQAALYAEMYPTRVRYSGAALSYAIGAVLGGAFAPTIAEALQSSTGTVYSVCAYLAGMTLIGLVATFFVRDRRDVPLGQSRETVSLSEPRLLE